MSSKRKHIEDFISEYNALKEQAERLRSIQDRLNNNEPIGYEGILFIGEEALPLTTLSGIKKEQLYDTFEEELKLFVAFLLAGNENKTERLMDSVSVNPDRLKQNGENPAPQPKERSTSERIQTFLCDHESGTVLNPSSVYDGLHEEVQNLSLSEVHQVCRRLVEEGKMSIVHNASCHKCSAGFSKVYEALPKSVICGGCGEDIVNIEIQYRLV